MSQRNEQTDLLLGDEDAGEGFLSAQERAEALRINHLSKTRHKRKKAA